MLGLLSLLLVLSQGHSCADLPMARDADGGWIEFDIDQMSLGRVLAKCEHEDEVLDQIRMLRRDVRRLTRLVERMDEER